MSEIKGRNDGRLRIMPAPSDSDVTVIMEAFGGMTAEVFSRAEIIKAIWPEGVEALECMMIGAWTCGIPNPNEREVLRQALDVAKDALDKVEGR